MDKPTDKESKTSVKLDGRQRKLLGTIDKESKWKDLKSIAIISNELEGLDIGEDFVGLGCSRYLNEAGANGRLDVEEMFRNCREAEKVRQRIKKKDKKERIEKQKRGGRGRGGTDKALVAQQKDTQKEDSSLGKKSKESAVIKKVRGFADYVKDGLTKYKKGDGLKEYIIKGGIAMGFDAIMGIVIAVMEYAVDNPTGTIAITGGLLALMGQLYSYVVETETGKAIKTALGKWFLGKLKGLLKWLDRNGFENILTKKKRRPVSGEGGGIDDDDEDGDDDDDATDYRFNFDTLNDIFFSDEEQEEEPTQEPTQQTSSGGNVVIAPSAPEPPQTDALANYIRMTQAQHTHKAEVENRENLFKSNPLGDYGKQGELETRADTLTAERVKEEVGGEKVKDVKGEEMGSKSSDLTGLNKRTTTSQKVMGTAFGLGGLYHAYNSIMGTAQEPPTAPVVVEPEPIIVDGEPVVLPTQEDLARPFRQPPHGGLRLEGDINVLHGGRQPFQGEGRTLRDSLVNQPQQPSTSQSGNLLEPRQNVNLEIRDLGMDGEPLDRTNLMPRHTLTRQNEQVGGAGSRQMTDAPQQTDITDQNLEEMKEGEDTRKREIEQQRKQLEDMEKEKQEREKEVNRQIDNMGRNGEAWGALFGMTGGQGKTATMGDLNSLYGNLLQSASMASRQQALQNLQSSSLLQTRERVREQRDMEQMELIERIQDANRQTRETARQGVSEAQLIATERQAERDRLQVLYDLEREPRPIPQLRQFQQLQLGSNIDNRLNILVNLYNDWRPTPQDTRPRTNVIRPALVSFLENFTTLNNMERADLVSMAFNGVRVSSLTQNSEVANRWINNRIINELDTMEEERARENMERRERGQRPLRPIYLDGRDATLRLLNATPMRDMGAEGAEEEEENPFLPTPPRQPKELQKKKKKK
jgi:hypothetical protein